jgi:glycosyltransferase involved in cell wall biosynthesis
MQWVDAAYASLPPRRSLNIAFRAAAELHRIAALGDPRAERSRPRATLPVRLGPFLSLVLVSPMLSIVIPVYNERESLQGLHRELDEVARQHGYDLDIVLVDDGSSDGSWQEICKLAERDPRVRGLRFRRNFGKAAALSAGFKAAQGEMVMTLDADLQDDPHEIPRFLAAMSEKLDVVSGWKRVRHDPWHKVLASRVFNAQVSWLTGVRLHDHNCGMKCYRRDVLGEVRLYGELHRFVPVLAAARGFAVGELAIEHRPRKFGHSKYGMGRFIKGFLDLLTVKFLTGFGQRPQHLLGAIGLVSFVVGGLGLIYLAGYWLAAQLHPDWQLMPLHERPAVIYSMGALLLGGQLMSIGFLAELITAYQFRDADTYSIAERTTELADKTTPAS